MGAQSSDTKDLNHDPDATSEEGPLTEIELAPFFIAKKILRFAPKYISQVNIILKEKLIPELLQDEMTAHNIVAEVQELLDASSKANEKQQEGKDAPNPLP